MSWIIYKHTNKINGKVYIGQTKQTPNLRFKNGLGYLDNNNPTVFARAIKKYGWENFETNSTLETNIETQEEANQREIFWIKHYRSYIGFPNCNGYNMTLGGDSGEHLGYSIYQIDKKTLKIVNEYSSISDASRQFGKGESNSSQIRNCCLGIKVSAKGYFWCYKQNYNKNWKPKDNELLSPVYQLDDSFEVIRRFDSIIQANKLFGFSRGSITSCCKRKQARANGYYWCYEKDYNEEWKPAKMSFNRNDKIYCFETNKIYSNAKEASKETGANAGKILRCCRNLENGTNGMHFCFPKDKPNYTLKTTNKRKDKFSNEEIEIFKKHYPILGVDIQPMLNGRTKKAISQEAHKLRLKYAGNSKHNKKVLCIEANKIFDSINEAYKWAGLKDGSSIGQCCKGKKKTAAGFHWRYN